MTSKTLSRTERLGARVSTDVKAILQRAADLTGRSLTDFIVASAQAAEEEAIRQHEVVQLSFADSNRLAKALLNPPAPNAELQAAVTEYRTFIRQDS